MPPGQTSAGDLGCVALLACVTLAILEHVSEQHLRVRLRSFACALSPLAEVSWMSVCMVVHVLMVGCFTPLSPLWLAAGCDEETLPIGIPRFASAFGLDGDLRLVWTAEHSNAACGRSVAPGEGGWCVCARVV